MTIKKTITEAELLQEIQDLEKSIRESNRQTGSALLSQQEELAKAAGNEQITALLKTASEHTAATTIAMLQLTNLIKGLLTLPLQPRSYQGKPGVTTIDDVHRTKEEQLEELQDLGKKAHDAGDQQLLEGLQMATTKLETLGITPPASLMKRVRQKYGTPLH